MKGKVKIFLCAAACVTAINVTAAFASCDHPHHRPQGARVHHVNKAPAEDCPEIKVEDVDIKELPPKVVTVPQKIVVVRQPVVTYAPAPQVNVVANNCPVQVTRAPCPNCGPTTGRPIMQQYGAPMFQRQQYGGPAIQQYGRPTGFNLSQQVAMLPRMMPHVQQPNFSPMPRFPTMGMPHRPPHRGFGSGRPVSIFGAIEDVDNNWDDDEATAIPAANISSYQRNDQCVGKPKGVPFTCIDPATGMVRDGCTCS